MFGIIMILFFGWRFIFTGLPVITCEQAGCLVLVTVVELAIDCGLAYCLESWMINKQKGK